MEGSKSFVVGIILNVEIIGFNDLSKTGVGEGMTPLPLSSDGPVYMYVPCIVTRPVDATRI